MAKTSFGRLNANGVARTSADSQGQTAGRLGPLKVVED
jgi:hypothetical protein